MSQSNVPNFVELGEAGIRQGYHGIGVRVNLRRDVVVVQSALPHSKAL
jgi:hypothetical protein